MHGWGTLHFPNGNKHVGNWVHNVKTGQGVFTWRNGDQYEIKCSKNASCHMITIYRYVQLVDAIDEQY